MDPTLGQYYLRQIHSKIVPVHVFSRLLKQFGNVSALLAQPEITLRGMGLQAAQVAELHSQGRTSGHEEKIDSALEWASARGAHLLFYEAADYPALLREIDCPPPVLFVRGSPETLAEKVISIVGSRRASLYGKGNAFWMAQELARAEVHICSGLASGIDSRAHEGALEGRGKTVAVVGTGIDRVYPPGNAALAERIVENGAIISEFCLGTPPYPANFPRRNRIISGLAVATLVIEANIKSGSLITARLAMEQNREVFAMPGPVGSTGSRGCHHLIKQGAGLVEEADDILKELGLITGEKPDRKRNDEASHRKGLPGNPDTAKVLKAMGQQGCLFESLLNECEIESQQLTAVLVQLEAAGRVQQLGGRYFRLKD